MFKRMFVPAIFLTVGGLVGAVAMELFGNSEAVQSDSQKKTVRTVFHQLAESQESNSDEWYSTSWAILRRDDETGLFDKLVYTGHGEPDFQDGWLVFRENSEKRKQNLYIPLDGTAVRVMPIRQWSSMEHAIERRKDRESRVLSIMLANGMVELQQAKFDEYIAQQEASETEKLEASRRKLWDSVKQNR